MDNHKPAGVKNNFHAYLMEATGLGGFVFFAGLCAIFIEHPALPVMQSSLSQHRVLRRLLLGLAMGAYLMGATILFGKRSGAHMNPSVTLGFLSLGKMQPVHAFCYVVAQLVGAGCGALLLSYFFHEWFSHPVINYAMTEPYPPHDMVSAFIAESIISFIAMFVVLVVASSRRLDRYSHVITGGLLALFITVELPFSGMSMNPARSFAASLAADKWTHIWIYCTAPVLFMLLATRLFIRWKKKKRAFQKEEDHQEIPEYPIKSP